MKFLIFVFCAFAGFALAGPHDSHPASSDRPSVHGMLVFGTKGKIYVSHLPMFHSPHDYQLLAELELPDAAKKNYLQSLAANPMEKIYTLVPETLALPNLVANPRPFSASLVRGHFERGGTEIAGEITVKLGKILHFKKFEKDAPSRSQATFLFFGTADECFLAHFISARPSFDQVFEASGSFPPKEGLAMMIQADTTDTLPLPTTFRLGFRESGSAAPMRFLEGKEIYLEQGDLQ